MHGNRKAEFHCGGERHTQSNDAHAHTQRESKADDNGNAEQRRRQDGDMVVVQYIDRNGGQ